ncbi:MAG: hypothetical protein HYS27_08035 [Deltaproteobacteria bacterium]|nr:hypothetical protein [Deltaproteobacteria bacterium]
MRRLLAVTPLLLVAACNGCLTPGEGEGEGEGPVDPEVEIERPFPRYTSSTRSVLLRTNPDGTSFISTFEPVGTAEIGGETYTHYLDDAPSGSAEVDATVREQDILIAHATFDSTITEGLGLPAQGDATFEPVISLPRGAPVGEPQLFALTGTAVVGGALPVPINTTAQFTVSDDDVEVVTPMGVLRGCSAFDATGVARNFFAAETTISGAGTFCPTFGLVTGRISEPASMAGLGLDVLGSADAADLGEGWSTVYKVAVLGVGGTGPFRLSSFDAHQANDADKETHAKMYLEVRWADDARAQTQDSPYLTPSFHTILGVFANDALAQHPSLLFPEDNAAGIVTWSVLVDQAAKNEADNGIAYGIDVNYDASFSAIRAAARIVYKVVQ